MSATGSPTNKDFPNTQEPPRLFGVLVTFRRQDLLRETLKCLLRQRRPIEELYVVDNEDSAETAQIVADAAAEYPETPIRYIATGDNLGPAGGWALGMKKLIDMADAADWIVALDDNNPPETETELEQVFSLAVESRRSNSDVGGVGITGAWFDWTTGRIGRVPDEELYGAISVDYLGGGFLSMYSVAALHEVGPFRADLFFGSVELEFGLRLRRAGYRLLAHGEMWRQRRRRYGRQRLRLKPSPSCRIHWQRYYRIRNFVAMMWSFGRWDLALKSAVIQCLLKPAYTSLRSPWSGCRGFLQAVRATSDAFRGQMGRTIDPPPGAPQRDYVLQRSKAVASEATVAEAEAEP